jgi:excinuclease UvrABC ATPase subunit
MLAKDTDAMQPHIRAFVERAVTFSACPECDGTRLSAGALSSRIGKLNIADACAMQITDLAEWVRRLKEPSVAPLLATLSQTLDSFVEIGLGYLSLERPSGTLSGGEAQRVKMIRQSRLLADRRHLRLRRADDRPPPARHRADERAAAAAARQGQHRPRRRAQAGDDRDADHVVDLGPGAGSAGGEVVFEGTVKQLRSSKTTTDRHLDDRAR